MTRIRHYRWAKSVNVKNKFHAFIMSKEIVVPLIEVEDGTWILDSDLTINQIKYRCKKDIETKIKRKRGVAGFGFYMNATYNEEVMD